MGAKTWMLVYSNGDPANSLKGDLTLDRKKSSELVQALFPDEKLQPIEDGDLSYTSPADNVIYAGCFSGVFVVAAKEFAGDYPSRLPPSFTKLNFGNTIHLHAMHSVVDWFAFAVWKNGALLRSLSLSPDSGIVESLGDKLSFELPFWKGEHPAVDPENDQEHYPLPFHPLELGEAALQNFFGYVLEGTVDSSQLTAEEVPLLGFKRVRRWWKLW